MIGAEESVHCMDSNLEPLYEIPSDAMEVSSMEATRRFAAAKRIEKSLKS